MPSVIVHSQRPIGAAVDLSQSSDPTYNRENVMSFIRECDFEYTAYFEQFQVYRLLASIKRTSGCEPIPHGFTNTHRRAYRFYSLTSTPSNARNYR